MPHLPTLRFHAKNPCNQVSLEFRVIQETV
jgi:hypothetical protein